MFFNLIYILLLNSILYSSVSKKIIRNSNERLIVELKIDALTESDIFPTSLIIGLPNNEIPQTIVEYYNPKKLPFQSSQKPSKEFEWINNQELQNLNVATLRVSPISSTGIYYQNIKIIIDFNETNLNYKTPNYSEVEFLEDRIINWDIAKSWLKMNKRNLFKNPESQSGKWFQFFLAEDGMVSLPYSLLASSFSDISNLDPRSISIFMSQELGRPRSQEVNQPIPENLIELPIFIIGENDGSFDINDKIIFYGRGPSGFDIAETDIRWNQNIYFNKNSCWLFIPNDSQIRGKRIEPYIQPDAGVLIDYGLSSKHYEADLINLQASGTEWVGTPIPSGGSMPLVLSLPDPKAGVNININARFRGHSLSETVSSYHELAILFNNLNGLQIGSSLSWSGSGARTFISESSNINLINGSNVFYIINTSSDPNSYPYFDNFEIQYGRELKFGENFEFTSPIVDQNVRFEFSGQSTNNTYLWDISDPSNIKSILIDDLGFCNVFTSSGSRNRYVLFDWSNINSQINIELKENQQFNTLRKNSIQANYIIIGPEQFRTAASDLTNLRNPAIFAGIETIYDEFSAGNPDPMAIRSFIQWTQENWLLPSPNCALILGDGGYDYRNVTGQSSIIIPTMQVQSSRTYATDDLLATIYGNIPEIATGRFPAKNEQEVLDFINKVITIETSPEFGPWRQTVTLVADDAARPEPNHGSISTGQSHTLNSEELANLIPKSVYVDKIYMMEYPEVGDASAYGVIKPDATQALLNSLNNGTAILSYIGHGSPYQLAQEKLLYLDRGDLNQINTGNKLALWIVGTCSFGHFDDPLSESFSEELIRAPMNAASMVISTTRPITVSGNERYTKDLFQAIFNNGNISDNKVGIILQSIKDGTSESQYFHLFGDPGMLLPMPKDTLASLTISPDTLRTLEIGSYTGTQSQIQGNGNGYIQLIDAERNIERTYDIASETYSLSYTLPGATLFRGQFSFSGQNFDGAVRIPQDISYSSDPAHLITYIYNENIDLRGSINSIQLAGGGSTQDVYGPVITFENSKGTRLEEGDHLAENENLLVRISDPIGINLTNEIGHEILITDLKSNNNFVLTNNFNYDKNSITTGTMIYSSAEKIINLRVKAWDSANNPSEKEIKLQRSQNNKLRIYNSFNFPNPFTTSTQFTFEVTQDCDLKLDIYTIGGRRIKSFERYNLQAGFHIINWNGLDKYGGQIANGVYIYRLKAIGKHATVSYIGRCAKFQ